MDEVQSNHALLYGRRPDERFDASDRGGGGGYRSAALSWRPSMPGQMRCDPMRALTVPEVAGALRRRVSMS